MQSKSQRVMGLLAACALAFITLLVFSLLRDYGPESAIRRFHEAIHNNDAVALQAVTEENIRSAPVQAILANDVGRLIAYGLPGRVVRTDRSPGRVIAATVYTLGNGTPVFALWVVTKDRGVWKVSVADSLRATLGARSGLNFELKNARRNASLTPLDQP